MVITPIFLDGHACGKSGNRFSYLCERTKMSPHSILMSLIAVLNVSFNYLNSQLAENKLKR